VPALAPGLDSGFETQKLPSFALADRQHGINGRRSGNEVKFAAPAAASRQR